MIGARIKNLLNQYPDPLVADLVLQTFKGHTIGSMGVTALFATAERATPLEHQVEAKLRSRYQEALARRADFHVLPLGLTQYGPLVYTYVSATTAALRRRGGAEVEMDQVRAYVESSIELALKEPDYRLNEEQPAQALIPWYARIAALMVKSCRKVSTNKLLDLLERVGGFDNINYAKPDELDQIMDWWAAAVVEAYRATFAYMDASYALPEIIDWFVATRPNIMNMSVLQVLTATEEWHHDEDRRRQAAEAVAQKERQKVLRERAASKAPVFVYGPYSFYALTAEDELIDEGLCQHHCVGGYWKSVKSGEATVISMRKSFDKRIATIELTCRKLDKKTSAGKSMIKFYKTDTLCTERQVRGPANQDITNTADRMAIGAYFAAEKIDSQEYKSEIEAAKAQHPPETLSGLLYGTPGVRGFLAGFGRRR